MKRSSFPGLNLTLALRLPRLLLGRAFHSLANVAFGVAPGYRIFRSPSNQVWFGTRGLAPDKALAEATVRQHRLYGWNQRANQQATGYSEMGSRPSPPISPTGGCSVSSTPTSPSRRATG